MLEILLICLQTIFNLSYIVFFQTSTVQAIQVRLFTDDCINIGKDILFSINNQFHYHKNSFDKKVNFLKMVFHRIGIQQRNCSALYRAGSRQWTIIEFAHCEKESMQFHSLFTKKKKHSLHLFSMIGQLVDCVTPGRYGHHHPGQGVGTRISNQSWTCHGRHFQHKIPEQPSPD